MLKKCRVDACFNLTSVSTSVPSVVARVLISLSLSSLLPVQDTPVNSDLILNPPFLPLFLSVFFIFHCPTPSNDKT